MNNATKLILILSLLLASCTTSSRFTNQYVVRPKANIGLEWQPQTNATSILVWVSINSNTNFIKLASLPGNATSTIISNLSNGILYFKVTSARYSQLSIPSNIVTLIVTNGQKFLSSTIDAIVYNTTNVQLHCEYLGNPTNAIPTPFCVESTASLDEPNWVGVSPTNSFTALIAWLTIPVDPNTPQSFYRLHTFIGE